jgi:hypothetical protein
MGKQNQTKIKIKEPRPKHPDDVDSDLAKGIDPKDEAEADDLMEKHPDDVDADMPDQS